MATTPFFLWGPHDSAAAVPESDVAGFGSDAPAMALAATTAMETALVSPEHGAPAVARPRLRRNTSGSGSGKQQQQAGGGAKKPPQRGLGVAELERLRCGGDPLRELGFVGDAGALDHPLLHYHHRHLPAFAFEAAAGASYCSPLLQVQPSAPAPPPPQGPVCHVQPHAAGAQRASTMAPEQQYFRDRWGRMGPFSPAGNGTGADRQAHLLPPLAPEHPSSQSTIWRPAASSSCLHTGHRCDLCSRTAGAATTTMPEYIFDLAAAMATARQGGDASFLVRERKRGGEAQAPAKKEVREMEFFPEARAHHAAGAGPDESEFAAPFSSSYGAGGRAAPQLDLSLRL